jgi:hypothetical protein
MRGETQVHRFPIVPIEGKLFASIEMPRGAQLLWVAVKDGEVNLWAQLLPKQHKVQRKVWVMPSGVSIPAEAGKYVGTFMVNEGGPTLVFHVFDGGEES